MVESTVFANRDQLIILVDKTDRPFSISIAAFGGFSYAIGIITPPLWDGQKVAFFTETAENRSYFYRDIIHN